MAGYAFGPAAMNAHLEATVASMKAALVEVEMAAKEARRYEHEALKSLVLAQEAAIYALRQPRRPVKRWWQ